MNFRPISLLLKTVWVFSFLAFAVLGYFVVQTSLRKELDNIVAIQQPKQMIGKIAQIEENGIVVEDKIDETVFCYLFPCGTSAFAENKKVGDEVVIEVISYVSPTGKILHRESERLIPDTDYCLTDSETHE